MNTNTSKIKDQIKVIANQIYNILQIPQEHRLESELTSPNVQENIFKKIEDMVHISIPPLGSKVLYSGDIYRVQTINLSIIDKDSVKISQPDENLFPKNVKTVPLAHVHLAETKKRRCDCDTCDRRRIHFENPDVMRKRQIVEVPIDWPDDKPVYCSIECACYAEKYSVVSEESV